VVFSLFFCKYINNYSITVVPDYFFLTLYRNRRNQIILYVSMAFKTFHLFPRIVKVNSKCTYSKFHVLAYLYDSVIIILAARRTVKDGESGAGLRILNDQRPKGTVNYIFNSIILKGQSFGHSWTCFYFYLLISLFLSILV
jgi:hypothetical protein